MPGPRLLDVVDATWTDEPEWETWARDFLDVATAAVSGRAGLMWRADVHTGVLDGAPVGDASLFGFLQDAYRVVPKTRMAHFHRQPTMTTSPHWIFTDPEHPWLLPFLEREYRARDFDDALTMIVRGPRESFMNVALFLGPSREDPNARRKRLVQRFDPVTKHVEAACEIRELLAAADGILADFDEQGRGEFRHPQLRKPLLEQARYQERLRDLDIAPPASWDALVSGRYSIIRYRQTDGGRLRFVALENPVGGIRALTPREREVLERAARGHSNKAIAIDFGLESASVANIVARCMRKIGVDNRAQLIALFGGVGGHREPA